MSKPLFNEEEKQFILENVKGRTTLELVTLLKEKMNKKVTIKQLVYWKIRNRITNDKPKHPTIFTNEQKQYLLKIINNNSNIDIVNMINKKFKSSFTIDQIRWYKRHHHLKSYSEHIWNKGKKSYNHQPVGSEFVYYQAGKEDFKTTFIKIAEPDVWVRKQYYMYEKYYGKIPKDGAVIFLNGNRDDFSKSNLKCITMHEHMFMMTNSLYFNNKDLTETGILIAKLKMKQKQLEV